MRKYYPIQIRMKRTVFVKRLMEDLGFKRIKRKSEMAKYIVLPEYYKKGDLVVSVPRKGAHGGLISIFQGQRQARFETYMQAWEQIFRGN